MIVARMSLETSGVSILVLMDVPLEYGITLNHERNHVVSILVLMDVPLEYLYTNWDILKEEMFQSLF